MHSYENSEVICVSATRAALVIRAYVLLHRLRAAQIIPWHSRLNVGEARDHAAAAPGFRMHEVGDGAVQLALRATCESSAI
jgi:hypothetical protein